MLEKLRSLLRKAPPKLEAQPEVLPSVESMSPEELLRRIAPFLLHRDPQTQAAAERLWESALDSADDLNLGILNSLSKSANSSEYMKLSLADIKDLNVDDHRNLLRVACRFHDGYVRQRALSKLGQDPQPLDWPFVLERTSDWVSSVQKCAKKIVRKGLGQNLAGDMLRWQHTLTKLTGKTRYDTSVLVREVLQQAIQDPDNRIKWRRMSPALRRMATSIVLADDDLVSRLSNQLCEDADIHTAHLLAENAEFVQPELLMGLLQSKMPAVRAEALDAVVRLSIGNVTESLTTGLLDPNIRVRSLAQYLGQKQKMDLQGFYREAAREARSTGAISGLGEVGEKTDASLIGPYLKHRHVRFRVAAAKVLLSFGATDLHTLFSDPSPKVRRVAIQFAKEHGSVPRLVEIL